jgi:hypothetical protein
MIGLALLGVILGHAAGDAGASVSVGVIFGVAAAVPTALAIALADRGRRQRPKIVNDNRQVIIYMQQPDGTLTQISEQEALQIAVPSSALEIHALTRT